MSSSPSERGLKLPIEKGPDGNGIQTIRAVVDAHDACNLKCKYCHPNIEGWSGRSLPVPQLRDVMKTSEKRGILEVTVTGGEITLRRDFGAVLETADELSKTGASFVTNATRITPENARLIEQSNFSRVCVSIDGPDAEIHNGERGNNFDTVMSGLAKLRETGKPVTIISVPHAGNYERLTELSWKLANEGLADQHHMCAPSYSGAAKDDYERLKLPERGFYTLQEKIDNEYDDLNARGLHVTFNSFWPATGEYGRSQQPRTMTANQVNEQVKNTYQIVRPNGDVRLTLASWGRETVGNAVVGNLNKERAEAIFARGDEIYLSDDARQLPREVEAGHKFHIGPKNADHDVTNSILEITPSSNVQNVDWVPVRRLPDHDLLDNPFGTEQIDALASKIAQAPDQWRVVNHASGVDLVYHRQSSHTTVLRPEETAKLTELYATHTND